MVCPDRHWVVARLLEAKLSEMLQRAHTRLTLEVSGNPGREYEGAARLETSVESPAPPWQRHIAGPRCEDVVSALIVSLSIHLESSENAAVAPSAREDPAQAVQRWGADGADFDLAASGATLGAGAVPWRIGAALGGRAHTHLGPGADLGMRLAVTSERAEDDGPSQSYALALSLGRGGAAPLPAELGALEWAHRWWSLGVEGCRWGVALGPRVRVEPCAGWHGGRYTAHIIEGPSRDRWLALAELTARLGFELNSWRGRFIVGGFAPIGPLSIRRQGRSFYEIGAGAILGVELAIAPLTP